MIRISRKCEYALRAVFELAMRGAGYPVKTPHIAASQDIPPRFLEVILNELRHAGLLTSRRGSVGGYMLAQPPEKLTVSQVIEHIQGPIVAGPHTSAVCSGSEYASGDIAFSKLWANVSGIVSGLCESTTFAELVASERRSRVGAVPDYVI